ncbi:11909_t:CDS:2, partial [Entrophospora sp. SA101]
KKENHYIEAEEFQLERLNNCCQTELKLEELLTRYKKGKATEKEKVSSLETELNENDEILAKKNSEISRLVNDLAAAYSTISQLNKQQLQNQ